MKKRIVLVPYKIGSTSCRLLKESLIQEGIRCFRKRPDSGYIPRQSDLVVYYGGNDSLPNSHYPNLNYQRNIAQNKLSTLRVLTERGLSTVEWTTDRLVAVTWPLCFARATLYGHSGQGITTNEQGQPLPDVPLYTKYLKKTYECRVHVMNGKVIDSQIKRKVAGYENVNTLIRNKHTGWVYCREDFTLPDPAAELSIAAVAALELNFGAVDLIYNKYYNRFYVLEVNTAPGLEGTTLANYTKELIHVFKAR